MEPAAQPGAGSGSLTSDPAPTESAPCGTTPAPAAPDVAPTENADLRLARAILARDRKATAEFVSLHADALYGYVRHRLLPRTDLADDLVQEVFLAAWKSLPSYQGSSSLRSWLLGIARHKVEDHYRAALRAALPIEETPDSLLADPAEPAEAVLDRARATARVHGVLSALPEPYAMALLWRYWERCPAREIAARTGRTEKAVERLLARARAQFKKLWNATESEAGVPAAQKEPAKPESEQKEKEL